MIRLPNLSVRLFFGDVQGQVLPGQVPPVHEANMLLVLIWVVHLLQQWADRGFQLIAITQFEIFVCVCFITGLYSDDVEPYEREILANFVDM